MDEAYASLAGLNPQQREAVAAVAGPVLILAGAGSGKTRVITHRIAHLVLDLGVPSRQILAVTFTNKAAAEMRGRVEALLGAARPLETWVSTFHSFCVRLLRREARAAGLDPGFLIYDDGDQLAAVREALGGWTCPRSCTRPGASCRGSPRARTPGARARGTTSSSTGSAR